MNKIIQYINSLFGGVVRKQSLSINPDGTHTCTSRGKSHIIKDLVDFG